MEWQTPAVSEKFQSRFGRRPGTADSGDTGLGTSASDSTEGDDFCMEHCLNFFTFFMRWGFSLHCAERQQAVLLDNHDHARTGHHLEYQTSLPKHFPLLLLWHVLRIISQWCVGVFVRERFIFHAHAHTWL